MVDPAQELDARRPAGTCARSPVLYIRAFARDANGSATNFSAVNSGRLRYPHVTAITANMNLARHSDGHRLQVLVENVNLGVGQIGRPNTTGSLGERK